MKLLSDEQVRKIIFETPASPSEYLRYLDSRIRDTSQGLGGAWADIKTKIIYDDPNHPGGDFRPMTCFTDRVKVVKVIATNPIRDVNPSISVGSVLVFDYLENYTGYVIDAAALSSIRTAAMAYLAAEWGMPRKPLKVALVGHGQVGKYFCDLYAAANMFPGEGHLHIYDPRYGTPVGKYHGKVNGYDVVVTATNSTESFLTPENCDAPLVVSVGADTHFFRELSHEFLLSREDIYVDVPEAIDIGDLRHASSRVHSRIRGNMAEYYEHRDTDIFISAGSPLMDALTVEFILERIRRNPELAR